MEPPERGQRRPGGQQRYSNHAIETALTIRLVFHLALRQTEGFLGSLCALLGVDSRTSDHTTVSRRARKLGKLPIGSAAGKRPVHILVDSTGLKIHVVNLRKPPKNRDWRKLHVVARLSKGEDVRIARAGGEGQLSIITEVRSSADLRAKGHLKSPIGAGALHCDVE